MHDTALSVQTEIDFISMHVPNFAFNININN